MSPAGALFRTRPPYHLDGLRVKNLFNYLKMNKLLCYSVGCIGVFLLLAGCSRSAETSTASGKLKIVATIFPEYDWTREILGNHVDEAELVLLLDSGVDLHNYEPTAQDLLTVGACNLFIHVGGASDKWVANALSSVPNSRRRVVNLLAVLGNQVREEEHVEGMEEHHHGHDEEDEDEDHEHHHDHDEEDESELDEHVWLSLRLTQRACRAIAEELAALDPTNAADYRANCEAYCAKLAKLDAQFQQTVDASPVKTLLFGDRFPFRYLADDYGLQYFAAFTGCSAEAEASFKTVAFLAGKVDELNLPCVLAIEGAQHRLAETIVKTTKSAQKCPVLILDSLQATTAQDAQAGKTYLGAMEKNLEVLRQALQN